MARGNYAPDHHTADDELEDELLEWIGYACKHHAQRTTEVANVYVDLDDDSIELTLRNGDRVAIVQVTEVNVVEDAPAPDEEPEADDDSDDEDE